MYGNKINLFIVPMHVTEKPNNNPCITKYLNYLLIARNP